MSVTINAKGTSVPSFTIGKGGVTLYQGSTDPSLAATPKNSDLWFDSANNSINIRQSGAWIAPAIGQLTFPTGTGTSGQVLTTNGSGILSFTTPSGVSSITGTANQVIASASTGAVTLSLPQDIGTTSAPTFVGTNITGIPNAGLAHNSITVGSTNIALGATSTTLAGLTSVSTSALTSAGALAITSANGTTTTSALNITSGSVSSSTTGSNIVVTGGPNTTASGTATGGSVIVSAGASNISSSGRGGSVAMTGGAGGLLGGAVQIVAGNGNVTGGSMSFNGGNGSTTGGSIALIAGTGNTTPGTVTISGAAGPGGSAGSAGNVIINGGGLTQTGTAGNVIINGGGSVLNGSVVNAGNVTIAGGAPNGTLNVGGVIIFSTAATSADIVASVVPERARITNSGNFIIGSSSTTVTSLTAGGNIVATNNIIGVPPALGASFVIPGAGSPQAGDFLTARTTGAGPNFDVGVIFFGNTGNHYLYWSGTTYNMPGGSLVVNGTTYPSDRKFKENILPITNGLDKITKLNGYTYTLNNVADKEQTHHGVIAQEVQKVIPELVTTVPADDMANTVESLAVDYTGIIPVLIEAIKELKDMVISLKTEIAELKGV